MDQHDLRENLKRIRAHYPDLGLSDDQAVKMMELEDSIKGRHLGLGVRGDHFSFWERQDYELDEVRAFLTEGQLTLFTKMQQEAASEQEKFMREQDTMQAKEVALNEEYIAWLREQFLPKVLRELIHVPILFIMEREKVAFLRAEYRNFVVVSKRNALVRHYRQSRGFEPNGLRLALLYQEQKALLPDYLSFMREADEAVRSVGNFLVEKYSGYAEHGAEFFKQKAEEISKQYAEMRLRRIGEREISGWHTTIKLKSSLTDAQGWLMSMMLRTVEGGAGGDGV